MARRGESSGSAVPGVALLEAPSVGRVSLADLRPGARAVVAQVIGTDPTARRLGELGFTPGTTVEVVRRAPLRDPVIYRVKDYDICVRRVQAAGIRVDEVSEVD